MEITPLNRLFSFFFCIICCLTSCKTNDNKTHSFSKHYELAWLVGEVNCLGQLSKRASKNYHEIVEEIDYLIDTVAHLSGGIDPSTFDLMNKDRGVNLKNIASSMRFQEKISSRLNLWGIKDVDELLGFLSELQISSGDATLELTLLKLKVLKYFIASPKTSFE